MNRYLVALFGLFASSAVLAESQPARTFYYDCEAPEARFGTWAVSVDDGAIDVTGSLEFFQSREDPSFLTTAFLHVQESDETQPLGLMIARERQSPHLYVVWLVTPENAPNHLKLGVLPPYAGPIPFAISLGRNGSVTYRIGEITRTLPVKGVVPKQIALGCSTGEVEFTSIRVQ